MAYDLALADRIRGAVAGRAGVTKKATLGGLRFLQATLVATGALAAVLAAPGCKSSTCYPQCASGYEPAPTICGCRPVADAATLADGSRDAADAVTSADGSRDGG
jgi:hypothetical protein